LRTLARNAAPKVRQRVVRALVEKGGAVLAEGRVMLTLRVREGSRDVVDEGAPMFSLVGSGYRNVTSGVTL
jgi:hypothetical protein